MRRAPGPPATDHIYGSATMRTGGWLAIVEAWKACWEDPGYRARILPAIAEARPKGAWLIGPSGLWISPHQSASGESLFRCGHLRCVLAEIPKHMENVAVKAFRNERPRLSVA